MSDALKGPTTPQLPSAVTAALNENERTALEMLAAEFGGRITATLNDIGEVVLRLIPQMIHQAAADLRTRPLCNAP